LSAARNQIQKKSIAVSAIAPKGESNAITNEVHGHARCDGRDKPARFPRSARLLRHADFERVYKQGRRHFSASMTVFYLQRPAAVEAEKDGKAARSAASGLRIGFTVGRALGGAVQRNRMKRRLREAVRFTRPSTEIVADVVINPKKSLLTIDFAMVMNEVKRAFVVIEEKLGQNSGKIGSGNSAVSKPNL
jgi:ribonuclease P protein component